MTTKQAKPEPTLAELRTAALKAYADHERDMHSDPEYRCIVRREEAKARAAERRLHGTRKGNQ